MLPAKYSSLIFTVIIESSNCSPFKPMVEIPINITADKRDTSSVSPELSSSSFATTSDIRDKLITNLKIIPQSQTCSIHGGI